MITEDLFFHGTNYFAWAGLFYLVIMTWQDVRKHKMQVDDRRNWFKTGVSMSLLSHVSLGWFTVLGLVIFNLACLWLLKKVKIFGEGDINAIMWINLGFGILSYGYLAVWLILFLFSTLLFYSLKTWLFRHPGPVPFFPVLLLSFFSSTLLLGLF